MSKNEFFIWEGVFNQFPDTVDHVFDSKRWSESFADDPLQDNDEVYQESSISFRTLIHEYPLSIAAASLAATLDRPIRILDFGGGLANSYFSLISSLPSADLVEFHVLETPAICRKGREMYGDFRNLHFDEVEPNSNERFDIVHAGSSLHYVADWRMMLKKFTLHEPNMIVLSGLTAGNIKTFATFQNYYGSKIPVWFWNIDEFIIAVKELRYRLVYKSLLAFKYLGEFQPLPMTNFPSEYQLQRKCNLIFSPEKKVS